MKDDDLLGQYKDDRQLQIDFYKDQLGRIATMSTIVVAALILAGSLSIDPNKGAREDIDKQLHRIDDFSAHYANVLPSFPIGTLENYSSQAHNDIDRAKAVLSELENMALRTPQVVLRGKEFEAQGAGGQLPDPLPDETFEAYLNRTSVAQYVGLNLTRILKDDAHLDVWWTETSVGCNSIGADKIKKAIPDIVGAHPALASANVGQCETDVGAWIKDVKAALRAVTILPEVHLAMAYFREPPPRSVLETPQFFIRHGDEMSRAWFEIWNDLPPLDALQIEREFRRMTDALSKAKGLLTQRLQAYEKEKQSLAIFGLQIPIPRDQIILAAPFFFVFLLVLIRVFVLGKRWAQQRVIDVENRMAALLGQGYDYKTFSPPLTSLSEWAYFCTGRWRLLYDSNPQFLSELGISTVALFGAAGFYLTASDALGGGWWYLGLGAPLLAETLALLALLVTLESHERTETVPATVAAARAR